MECFPVLWLFCTQHSCLEHNFVSVKGDQVSQRWLIDIIDPNNHLIRCLLRLGEFYFRLSDKKRILNMHSDSLFEFQTLGETVTLMDENIPCFTTDKGNTLQEKHDALSFDCSISTSFYLPYSTFLIQALDTGIIAA